MLRSSRNCPSLKVPQVASLDFVLPAQTKELDTPLVVPQYNQLVA
jgi:hypothetical protein